MSLDQGDDYELATDRSTAASRIPITGALDITSEQPYVWEGSIRWGNLRWWALGAAVVAFSVWLFLNWNLRIVAVVAIVAAVVAFWIGKAIVGYVELADRWATVQVKRHEARPSHRCAKCSHRERQGR